jgi:uncharacterized membrane protein YbaN (DUF454 family)
MTLPVEPPADRERPPETVGGARPVGERGPLQRGVLVFLGALCVALGTLGAFLPVLPTTPFLLLASACFARSSPAFQRRLLANRVFGPYLRQWQHDHTIPRAAKRKAYGLIVVTFGVSIGVVEHVELRWLLAGLGLGLLGFLAWLPVTPSGDDA